MAKTSPPSFTLACLISPVLLSSDPKLGLQEAARPTLVGHAWEWESFELSQTCHFILPKCVSLDEPFLSCEALGVSILKWK